MKQARVTKVGGHETAKASAPHAPPRHGSLGETSPYRVHQLQGIGVTAERKPPVHLAPLPGAERPLPRDPDVRRITKREREVASQRNDEARDGATRLGNAGLTRAAATYLPGTSRPPHRLAPISRPASTPDEPRQDGRPEPSRHRAAPVEASAPPELRGVARPEAHATLESRPDELPTAPSLSPGRVPSLADLGDTAAAPRRAHEPHVLAERQLESANPYQLPSDKSLLVDDEARSSLLAHYGKRGIRKHFGVDVDPKTTRKSVGIPNVVSADPKSGSMGLAAYHARQLAGVFAEAAQVPGGRLGPEQRARADLHAKGAVHFSFRAHEHLQQEEGLTGSLKRAAYDTVQEHVRASVREVGHPVVSAALEHVASYYASEHLAGNVAQSRLELLMAHKEYANAATRARAPV